jgi:hypothetical protein
MTTLEAPRTAAPSTVAEAATHHARGGLGIARPWNETHLAAPMRIPRWLAALLGASLAAGPVVGLAARRPPAARVLRGVFATSTLAYLVAASVDLAEHLRLEKEVTGHRLRWTVVPPSETAVHAGIIATKLSVLLLARPLRRPAHLLDVWLIAAPGVFLALGWLDELAYHRRRTPHREDIIHATQHLAEGIMWTSLYATHVCGEPPRERSRRVLGR